MRKLAPFLFVLSALFALAALAQSGGLALIPATRISLDNCPSGGGDGGVLHARKLVEGRYIFRVLDETTSVCVYDVASDGGVPNGCNDGGVCPVCTADGGVYDGDRFSAGTTFMWGVPRSGQVVSCRSQADGGGGDVAWTRVQ